jgi:hypothetical protein
MEPNPSQLPQPSDEPAIPHSPGQVFGPDATPPQSAVASPSPIIDYPNPSLPPQAVIAPDMPKQKRRFRFKKQLAIVLVVMVALLGGSAAAYLGYYMPNKSQNILAQAVSNTLQQHQITSTGSFDITTSGVSGRATYTVQADTDNHSLDIKLDQRRKRLC